MTISILAQRAGMGAGLPGLFLVLIACAAAPIRAQQPALRFGHFTRDHGLSHNTVNTILEDHIGFMWFGTYDGLNRYDGNTFTRYRNDSQDPYSLSHNVVRTLLEDREQVLWIGTEDGLNRYDRARDTFILYRNEETDHTSVSNNLVYALYEDREGELWIGTYWGLNRFDRDTQTFVRYPVDEQNPERGPSQPHIRALTGDSQGYLWIAISGGGLNRFDPKTGTFVHYLHDKADPGSISQNDVRAVFVDRTGTLWVGTHEGLNRFDREAETFVRYLHDINDPSSISSNHIEAILEDSEGQLWIGTDGGGLNLYDWATDTFFHYQHNPAEASSLNTNVSRALYEDRQGNLWVGNFSGGVHFYNKANATFSHYRHQATNPNSLSHSAVLTFFEEKEDLLWIGTEGGLNRFDRPSQTFRRYRHDPRNPQSLGANAVLAVLRDTRGNLWVGTYFGGLNRLVEANGTFVHYQPDPSDPHSLSSPHVWDLVEDREGQLWIATYLGLNRFDYDTGTFIRYPHDPNDDTSIGHNEVWSLYEDASGTLWAGTKDGLSVYDREQDHFRTYRHDEQDSTSLSNDHIYAMLEDREGALWVGTSGGGLNRFDRATESFTAYRTQDGLPNDVVYGILEDEQGNLWISTNGGLSKFDPRTETFTNYDKSNGLLAEPFTRKAAMKSRTGEMFFGGNNGFNSFFPQDVQDNPHLPPIVLTDFQVLNKPVPIGGSESPLQHHITEAEQIHLRYDQSVISFAFSALNYRAPKKNQYAYMLEGFDPDWTYVGPKRTATYTNLDPGTYTFRVKGSNNSGLWNEQGTAIKIVVSPPFWATWWFRALMIVGVLGLLLGAYQIRMRSIRARNRALQAEVAERKRVEEAVKASEERLRLALDAARMGTWNWGMRTNEVTWSEHVESIFGLPPGAFAGTYEAYLDLISPDDLDGVKQKIAGALAGGQDYEVAHRIRWPDGSLHWLEGKGRVYRNAAGQPVRMTGTVTDITERKQAEEALQESEERYRALYNKTPVMLHSIDRNGRLLSVSDFWLETLGYQHSEVVGRQATDFLTEESRRYAKEVSLPAFFETGVARGIPYQFVKKNGEVIDVLLSAIAERDESGEIARSLAVLIDITERKQAEAEREQLIEELKTKNAELERFAYTVSHDLKSPLVTIKGFLGLLQKDIATGDTERANKDISQIASAADKMGRLLGELLELSRIGRLMNPPEAVSLTELAHEAAELVAGRISERGAMVEIAPEMPVVVGDRIRLIEVYQNLLDNAVKFTMGQPAPHVEVGARVEGTEVLCYVQDNGMGIDPAYHERVFRLFEQLNPNGEGTGIGLALVKRIVEVHRGRIWIESEGTGRGSTFWFTLPRHRESAHEAARA